MSSRFLLRTNSRRRSREVGTETITRQKVTGICFPHFCYHGYGALSLIPLIPDTFTVRHITLAIRTLLPLLLSPDDCYLDGRRGGGDRWTRELCVLELIINLTLGWVTHARQINGKGLDTKRTHLFAFLSLFFNFLLSLFRSVLSFSLCFKVSPHTTATPFSTADWL